MLHRSQSSLLGELWDTLQTMASEKGLRLHEALEQQQFLHAIKDVDLWLEEVEKQLSFEELGKVCVCVCVCVCVIEVYTCNFSSCMLLYIHVVA